MPRKAKDKSEEIEVIDEKKSAVKKTPATKTAKKKSTTTVKSTTAKKTSKVKKSTTTKKTDNEKKTNSTKKASTVKSSTTKKNKDSDQTKTSPKKTTSKKTTATKKATAKKTTAKKATTKKPSAKKSTAKKATKSKKSEKPVVEVIEYYDLPYKYGDTVVRLLAQTPKTLFVYWEVSEKDIENFKKTYGDDFFNKTRPILIIHNLTLNKTTEIEINDFANCWYVNTEDSDCKFDIELARKFVDTSSTPSNSNSDEQEYVYIAKSNELQAPNNHILFEKIQEFVVFKDVNNDNKTRKNIESFKFLKDIYQFYKDMYDEEILNNPSSQFKF